MDNWFAFLMIMSPAIILIFGFYWIKFNLKYAIKMIPLLIIGSGVGVLFSKWMIYCAENF